MNEFEKMFDARAIEIWKIIESLAENNLTETILKLESEIYILHSVCEKRFSKEYLEKSLKLIKQLESLEKTFLVKNVIDANNSGAYYFRNLIAWWGLQVEERYALPSNLNRVDFKR